MIFLYIFNCLRQGVRPWLYFQLNAHYFNVDKKIFSKLDIDQEIPLRWRLEQAPLTADTQINNYPVFIKPEWGQNSYGIKCINTKQELIPFQSQINDTPYIYQQAATEKLEIEIFYIREANTDDFAILNMIKVVNHSGDLPVNSVYNTDTHYQDITHQFSEAEQQKIWSHLKVIGHFRFARVGLKVNSMADLIKGLFHIIEINLFAPMPLNLLDPKVSSIEKHRFIDQAMWKLVKITAEIPTNQVYKSIFFNKVKRHYQIKP